MWWYIGKITSRILISQQGIDCVLVTFSKQRRIPDCSRNRQSGDGKYVTKLTLEELQCFRDQIETLPCKVKEGPPIEVRGGLHGYNGVFLGQNREYFKPLSRKLSRRYLKVDKVKGAKMAKHCDWPNLHMEECDWLNKGSHMTKGSLASKWIGGTKYSLVSEYSSNNKVYEKMSEFICGLVVHRCP